MKRTVLLVLALVLASLLLTTSSALAVQDNIGGVGVTSTRAEKLR